MEFIQSFSTDFWAGFSFGLIVSLPTVLLVLIRNPAE